MKATAIIVTATAVLATAGVLLFAAGPEGSSEVVAPESSQERSKEVLSETYQVTKKYRSMMGPFGQQDVLLGESETPELLWITGYRAVMVGADGESRQPQEFMCHSNLDLDPAMHNQRIGSRLPISGRLFTLSQGQFEIDLPTGFGIPLMSDESLRLTTQVLNLNHDEIDIEVRHKVEVEYVRDQDLDRPLKPLFSMAAYGLASLEDEELLYGRESEAEESTLEDPALEDPALEDPAPEEHGPSCLVRDNASTHEYKDRLGRRFTGHWVVQPGREVNRTLVTDILSLPFDTTVHYIAVHLHPFAESLELKDLTTGETVFKSKVRPAEKGIGIEHVEYYSSPQGIPLSKAHDYEMVSVYNNTSQEPQDSMAVMYVYLLDTEFKRP